jgi:hypothetical protein
MGLREIGWSDTDWINLVQDRNKMGLRGIDGVIKSGLIWFRIGTKWVLEV